MHRRQYPRWNEDAFRNVLGHYHVLPEQKVGHSVARRTRGFNLALALAQGPELLVLDEPTLGLDVVAKRAFLESLMYSNATDDCTVIYCSHQMEEIERVADNLIILERGKLMHMSAPDDFCARVTHWVADIPFKRPDPKTVPGLLQLQRLDGLHHYLVLDQDEDFADFLRASGARGRCKACREPGPRASTASWRRYHAAPDTQRAHAMRTHHMSDIFKASCSFRWWPRGAWRCNWWCWAS
jgi:ABC-2 type transport system ATP-binding protein